MRAEEAIQITGMFMSAFPNTPADDGTIDLWVTALTFVDVTLGRRVAMDLINRVKFFPTIAEFNEALSALKRRADYEESGRPAISQGRTVPPAEGLQIAKEAYIAECRLRGRLPNPATVAGFDRGMLGGARIEAS